jgi:hypothetical protein
LYGGGGASTYLLDLAVVRLASLTESLERAQRARLDQVILDWERLDQPARPSKRSERFVQLIAWLIQFFLLSWLSSRRRTEALAFDSYLSTAHLHPAVARQSSSASRRWFADWRLQVRMALWLGISPHALLALLRSTPAGAPARAAAGKPVPHTDTELAESRERLKNVIFPNAPGPTNSLRHLMTGDGLATARI